VTGSVGVDAVGTGIGTGATSAEPLGRAVIVSGVGGGLGRAIVAHLLGQGCTVVGLDIDLSGVAAPPGPAEVQDRFSARSVDLSSSDSVEEAVARAVQTMGRCDAVVAAAGVVDTVHRAERFPDDAWDRDMAVNLGGAFRLARAAFPHLRDSGDGRIVFISSVAARYGQPGQAAYAAAKAGLIGLTASLATEWASHRILVNAVVPGPIETPKVLALPESVRARLLARTALGRFATPAEVAGVAAFFLSAAAGALTGTTLQVDAGFGLNDIALTGGSR
jgi:NAD(P)-dependent dehydrogenase (short-subunit alcohol dehydrogenase family)